MFAQPKARRGRAAAAPLRELGDDPETGRPVVVRSGRFGPYVTDGTTNASLRKGDEPETITIERAAELLADRRAAGPPVKRARATKRAAKKPAAAKKATKKAAGAKKAAGPRRRRRRRPGRRGQEGCPTGTAAGAPDDAPATADEASMPGTDGDGDA